MARAARALDLRAVQGAMSEELRQRLIDVLEQLTVGPDEYMSAVCVICGCDPCNDDCERKLLLEELER